MLIDVLVIGFILCCGNKFRENLKWVKDMLCGLCYEKCGE